MFYNDTFLRSKILNKRIICYPLHRCALNEVHARATRIFFSLKIIQRQSSAGKSWSIKRAKTDFLALNFPGTEIFFCQSSVNFSNEVEF